MYNQGFNLGQYDYNFLVAYCWANWGRFFIASVKPSASLTLGSLMVSPPLITNDLSFPLPYALRMPLGRLRASLSCLPKISPRSGYTALNWSPNPLTIVS